MHLILEIQRSVAFGGFKLKVVANIFTRWEIIKILKIVWTCYIPVYNDNNMHAQLI